MSVQLKIEHCPKYDDCNAPTCPLDKYWKQRTHIKDDPVCFYLREVVKDEAECSLGLPGQRPAATEAQGGAIPRGRSDPFYAAAVSLWADRDSLAPPLVKQLLRASKTGKKGFRKEAANAADQRPGSQRLQPAVSERPDVVCCDDCDDTDLVLIINATDKPHLEGALRV